MGDLVFTTFPPSLMEVSPAYWNYSDHVNLDNLKMDSNFIWLLCSLVSTISWVIYIAYYNSRVIGYILTKLLNRFIGKDSYFKIGSFTLCALSGKIMFRDVAYITTDYSVRVQDGYLIFRWWRSYVPKDVSEDLSHSDTRLSVMLNGFELHCYNRCQMYAQLEKTFGLTPQMFSEEVIHTMDDQDTAAKRKNTKAKRQQSTTIDVSRHVDNIRKKEAYVIARTWRDLIPVIKLDICTGRLVFGNCLVPTTLSITVEEAHFVYSTKPAASRHDHFMHFTKCKAENFKVILAPSPKYTGMVDEPPRYMGEGFVVLNSNNMELYYYMDEPGVVPEHPEMIRLVNGDMVEAMPPIWGIDIKCGKGTDFSYGPWADRQREHLFKFFFPNDYQPLKVTKAPVPGDKRQVQSFDVRLSTLNEATIDILFSKNKETNAVHVNIGPGSYLEITMPWIVLQNGYTTKITGQLLHLEATTSLQYRSLVESETLEFVVKCHYPIIWNDEQEWTLNLTGCKATANLVYSHKEFFQDMISDWSNKSRPDILYFVPYTWKFSLLLKEFEIITICNEFNWIDCSSQNQENAHIAFCGEIFDLSFDLPFIEFLSPTIPLRFWIQAESVDLTFYLPEVNTNRNILVALDKNALIQCRDGTSKPLSDLNKNKKWRNICQNGLGWIDCWSVPIVALSINYTYHPCSPSGPTPQANITTPEKEEILLSPMRIPRCRKSPGLQWAKEGANKFDPLTLEPDKLSLELEIGPSILFLNGSLIKNFIHLKENIFGDYQAFTDMQQTRVSSANVKVDKNKDRDIQNNSLETSVEDEDTKTKPFDPREYRPMEVTVGITIHDVQAHLLKNCNDNDPPCPVILLERFGFEMKKGFKETELQLLLSPAILLLSDEVPRSNKEKHLNQGHLMLSALQVRGHAMFSNEGRNLDEETLEYSWLIEVQLGKLSGKMTSPQLHHLITSLETFLLMAKNSENCLRSPGLPNLCHHGLPPLQCADSDIDKHYRCPSSEDIKYRMTRVAIDSVDLYIQESGTASQVWISPVRVSTCNLHGQQVKAGMTGILPTILIRQFVSAVGHFANTSNTNTTASGRSYNNANSRLSGDGSDVWLEVGSVSMGPIVIEAAISLPTPEHNLHLVQNKYLKTHDEKTKRLWFLWTQDSSAKMSRCGCIGGCAFFGNNRNGPRFFKPNHHDLQDGINIAAYRIYEIGKDKGFGQSILHDGQLVFHTPPYSLQDVTLQDINSSIAQGVMHRMQGSKVIIESSKSVLSQNRGSAADESDSAKLNVSSISPFSGNNKKSLGRRFSYTSNRNNVKDVPYSRLVDASPITQLPPKLDSDSKLDSQRSKSILSVPEIENTPKSSASDSKLAVDYFYIQETESLQQCANPQIMCANRLKSNGMTQVMLKNNEIVNVSDSQHSLYVQSDSEDKLIQEVQRTVSMSSENHSEAFYSADEDTSHGMGGSQNSSVRHSLVSTGYVFNQSECIKKKFLSDLSIVESSGNVNYTAEVIPEKAHTLERTKPQSANVCKSPRFHMRSNCQTGSNVGENELLQDSSDSHSVSSTSFISAVSSQEDMTLVNLHMQVNKPIVDSPLLMSSYVSHLTQLRCNNWFTSSLPSTGDAFTTPLFKRTEDGRLVYIGGCYIPKYDVITEGFTSLKMINRNDVSPKASSSNRTPTHPYLWDNSTLIASEEGEDNLPSDEEELLTAQHENGSRTTVIVKLKGDIDVMLTPLVLECLQRFIDAITPTLINLHPLTILNHLHNECIRRVEDANILKQDQSLSYWSQVQASSKRSTAERNIKHDEGKVALQTSVYEESIATQIQGNIILPKINVTLLQASVVEEIISFSALDNIRDLTCVSLFAICLDDVTARFYLGKQAREIVQTFHKPAVLPNQKKVNKITKAFLSGHQTAAVVADIGGGETVYIETSEKQQEEIIVTLNIGKAHTQLRRLRNESSILKDAVITAIPSYYSRVLFTCTRITSPLKCVDYYLIQPSDEKEKQCKQNNPPQATEEFTVGCGVDRLGFIMFECGLEGIKLKIVKRSQFEKGDNGYGEKKSKVEILQKGNINKSQDELNNIAASTMDTLEQDLTTASSLNATGLQNQPHVNSSINAVNTTTVIAKQLSGNTVSCVIELRTVWFNFAAPPRTPITRKIDYTRLDWNLLSTASPAINAWMNPSNRFAIQIVHMFRCMYRRSTAVVACLMAEALDVQAIHMPIKSRYGRLTPLAKTLQEDPSCQLCSILQNYTLLSNLETIEANLCETDLPSLSTLRQGVIVLSRQWKNVLYTPLLLEHNYKTKHIKPVNVAYAVSDPEEENAVTDGEGSGADADDQEVTDECAMLIHADHMHKHLHLKNVQDRMSVSVSPPREKDTTAAITPIPETDSLNPSLPLALAQSTKSLQATHTPASARTSIAFPLLTTTGLFNHSREAINMNGVVLRQGNYLSATADIGIFEHSLTTDLLNHLVFVQKVFMKEVNEVVQKVYGGEKPVPLWLEDEEPAGTSSLKRILFSLIIRIKRIQLTATTPTNSAVRLETGAFEFQLSNRVQNVSGSTQPNPYMKLFGKAQVDINLSLGQLLKNVMFEEAEPEFQQFAFFNTRVGLRNAFQEEMAQGEDKEVVLITLKRPLIYIQPMAVDKAILVWLNYKNAYEYWNEKRSNLNKEVLTATQQVFEKVPFGQLTSQLSAPHLGTLFLQLTIDDMGICIPLNPLPPKNWGLSRGLYDGDSRGAVVITLENTSISACSSGSLVSKARFIGLCLRFAEDFETSLDDWKPDMSDNNIMNLCVVSEGTYEVCSRTIAQKQDKSAKVTENAKWILNVQWQMEGVDIHLDVSVGQQLSALGHTLTMLTGSEEDDAYASLDYDSDDIDQPDNRTSQESILIKKSKNWTDRLPAFVFDPSIDAKKRSKLIEKEMNEQAKIINDLRSLGASHGTIEQEMKRLHELEAVVFKDFRRDMIQKLRRQSVKASGIRGKLGLGGKSNSYRSRSFIVPSPTPEHHIESPEDLNLEINSANSGSYESSPKSGPSRSASLKVKGLSGPRVTFSDTHTMCRQSSLPSAGSDLSLPEGSLDWPDTIEIEGEQVQLRKKNKDISSTSSYDSTEGNNPLIDAFGRDHVSTTSSPYIIAQKPQEPNIDFELDVKVLINSGKCVLHTKDSAKEDELKIMSRMKKERSCSGGTFEFQPSSPSSGKKNISSKEKSTISSSRLRYIHHANVPLVDLTIFHIPGLDVKVHYESKTISEEAFSPRISIDNPILNPSLMSVIKKSSTKKASLFAWMTLQSIPEETIISPHILEFLEQTLEPIPSKTNFQSGGQSAMFPLETMESSWAATAASTNYVYASFPVDVIVYFHMQPSTFRFSCLPVSRVECMLQLPSLDIIFSSKRAEEELMEFGECKPTVGQHFTGLSKESGSATGGLSVTGCLADFSVYIFHPYGGGKKSGLKEAQWSPLSDSERKDSLSINVEFVKFHLSRSRKQNFTNEQLMIGSDTSRAVIRFSTIVDIGSASFKYDMRRLTEILAFPKAWYRRSIVRRLFLGDLSSGLAYSEEDASPNNKEEAVIGSSLLKHHDKYIGELLSKSVTERSPTSNREKLRLSFDNDAPKQIRLKDIGRGWSFTSEKQTASEIKLREPAWETLVLFAINFTRLNVHMNMGNVMGNVSWMTKDFRSDGRLSIGSTGHKNLYIGIGLGGSSLDAKGGIVGGIIELSKIDTYIHICEEPDTEPDHTVGLKLFALELRLDYMGTSVLMSRVSSLDVTLRDEWKINRNSNGDAFMPTRRPAIIFMHGDLGWDQLQIMISKSTTADLLKMFYKLDEFFSQQFKSSKRVFSSLQTRQQKINNSSIKKKHMKKRANFEGTWLTNQAALTDARHHRHWQRVLSQVSGLQLGSLRFSLPTNGTVLGGTMELHGSNISLACFHGINFKSKSWALFSLKEPCISFATEAQEIPSVESPNSYDVHVVQTLTISLGQQQEQHARHHSMATVCRLSRSVLFPPQFKSLQEWFHYAFANSEIDAIDRFPCVERERSESTSESSSSIRGRNSSTTSGKLQEHSHTREVIFALPSLQLHLKTEHLQTAKTPDVIGDKPLVECSFITEFEDHIFVTVDAEAFFFLHDLITSYVKEKERVVIHAMQHYSTRAHSPDSNDRKSAGCSTSLTTSSVIIEDDKKRKQYDPAEMFIKDWRSYRCKTWHLEPTVRLLSWAGKSIEPYGIDYILQKLGFSHARTTIPKWIQRGFMDPLDKVLAVIMLRMILAVREEVVNEKAYKKG
ncbi:transmembrane protein KIAA1109 isoform X10 [Nasonia vitripennis]|uniref:Bridge-like lipid transfer protein family member 1 C-terminal domain-containing protein n=1 Tax=Nasonia vitripennis TaxID=7425 RepID=A0A7M7PXV3_NASVI|nr:transmembrane protein KIAA1109 isoform X10 [Nasonia vitripennis]